MPNAASGEEWDEEYRDGRWGFLLDVKEVARTGAIAGWLRATGTGQRVLDIGCGEGVLFSHLDRPALESYVGVVICAEALARARVDRSVSRLVEADLQGFEPAAGESFTAVVFNEVLHFAEDPGAELARAAQWLAPGGVIAVSMYAPWKETGGGYAKVTAMETASAGPSWTVLDALELVSQAKNVRWRLRLIRPAGA